MSLNNLTAYEVEKKCSIANGYLKRQKEGSGNLGSDVLVRILKKYPDLNILWLLTGDGKMINEPLNGVIEGSKDVNNETELQSQPQSQPQSQLKKSVKKQNGTIGNSSDPLSHEFVIQMLQSQIAVLNATVADKSQIIEMLQEKLRGGEKAKK